MLLNSKDTQAIKKAIHMINAHTDKDEIGKYLDRQDNVSDALATYYAIYTSHIYRDRTDELIDSDFHNDEGLDHPYTYLAKDSEKVSDMYEDYEYPIVKGNPEDVTNPDGSLMCANYGGEIKMPALKQDLLSLVKKHAKVNN